MHIIYKTPNKNGYVGAKTIRVRGGDSKSFFFGEEGMKNEREIFTLQNNKNNALYLLYIPVGFRRAFRRVPGGSRIRSSCGSSCGSSSPSRRGVPVSRGWLPRLSSFVCAQALFRKTHCAGEGYLKHRHLLA